MCDVEVSISNSLHHSEFSGMPRGVAMLKTNKGHTWNRVSMPLAEHRLLRKVNVHSNLNNLLHTLIFSWRHVWSLPPK